MNRFLDNLAVRLQNPAEGVQPRTPSRFEPEAVASPHPALASETVWEDMEGLEQGEPRSTETARPEPGGPRRALPQRAPAGLAQPPMPSEDAAAIPSFLPSPALNQAVTDDPQAPDQTARPSASSEASMPQAIPRVPGVRRDEAGTEASPPSAAPVPPTRPARQAPDEERRVEVTPRAGAVIPTGSLAAETQAARWEQAPPLPPMIRAAQDVPVSSAPARATEPPPENTAETAQAPPGGRSPQPPFLFPDPARASAPVASAEAGTSPGGALAVETVTMIERGEAAPTPETPGRRPAGVTVRAAPAPAVPAAGSNSPVPRAQRDTPAPAPTIQVTIGRIEVRAAAPAPRTSSARPAPPKLTLEEYLRDGGRK